MNDPQWAHPLAIKPETQAKMATVVPWNGEWVAFDTDGEVVARGSTREIAARDASYNNYVVKYGTKSDGKKESITFGNIVIEARHLNRLHAFLEETTWAPKWAIDKIQKQFPSDKSFKIPGTAKGTQWIVTIHGNGACQCTCPAYIYGSGTDRYGFCKHIHNILAAHNIAVGYKNSLIPPEMLKNGDFMRKQDYDIEVQKVLDARKAGRINETEKNFSLKQLREGFQKCQEESLSCNKSTADVKRVLKKSGDYEVVEFKDGFHGMMKGSKETDPWGSDVPAELKAYYKTMLRADF